MRIIGVLRFNDIEQHAQHIALAIGGEFPTHFVLEIRKFAGLQKIQSGFKFFHAHDTRRRPIARWFGLRAGNGQLRATGSKRGNPTSAGQHQWQLGITAYFDVAVTETGKIGYPQQRDEIVFVGRSGFRTLQQCEQRR